MMKQLSRSCTLLLMMIVLMGCFGEDNVPDINEPEPTVTELIKALATQTKKPTSTPSTLIPVATKNGSRPTVTPTIKPNHQTITFWYQFPPQLDRLLERFVSAYNESNPYQITVSTQNIEMEKNIYEEMWQARIEGNPPHLIMSAEYDATIPQIQDSLVDLVLYIEDERFGLSEEEQKDDFNLLVDADLSPGEPLYHFPASRSLELIYYNLDLLQQLGFEEPPTTWDALQQMACAARDAGYIGYEFTAKGHDMIAIIFSWGGELITVDQNAYTFDDYAATSSMSFLQQLVVKECAVLTYYEELIKEKFGNGQSLLAMASSAELASYQDAVAQGYGGTWSITPLPHTTTEPILISYGPSFSILNSTPEQQLAAWLFVKWYTDTQQQADWAQLSNHLPVRQSAVPLLKDYFTQNPFYEKALTFASFRKSEPNITGYDLVHGLLAEVMIEIIKGADVPETLTDLNEEANTILKQQQ